MIVLFSWACEEHMFNFVAYFTTKIFMNQFEQWSRVRVDISGYSTLYSGTNLLQYSDPIKLKQEIDKYLKDVTIEKAFINRYTGQLCIITGDEASISKITNFKWPKKAFGSQITLTTNKKIFYMAIHGIHASTDVDSLKIENCTLKRNFKKSTKQPTKTIQITTDDESTYSKLLKYGKYKFGYSSVRITPWTFDPKPVQCHNCSKIGHTQMTCSDTKPSCPICTGEHTLTTVYNNHQSQLTTKPSTNMEIDSHTPKQHQMAYQNIKTIS
ncbi:hypothetical protein BpHYR1_014617 [Brachionus plicatilis]|uniref:CCHC-type domain-containing protein n=1 Tax=Brachionus plicatilis TaxID=10195 RepID=A0A3M7QI73_BRAPC|nr:hypothetical protein BpHYR1_014617 [Brachionus plicatilis]